MNNKETLSKELRADRVTLFVQFWFKFANKRHFKNQAVKFILTFFKKKLKLLKFILYWACLSMLSKAKIYRRLKCLAGRT